MASTVHLAFHSPSKWLGSLAKARKCSSLQTKALVDINAQKGGLFFQTQTVARKCVNVSCLIAQVHPEMLQDKLKQDTHSAHHKQPVQRMMFVCAWMHLNVPATCNTLRLGKLSAVSPKTEEGAF